MIGGTPATGLIVGGLYVAPLIPPAGGIVTITAVEANDSTQTASSTATVIFGTATMQGSYTFSVSGVSSSNSGGPFARAGSFSVGVNGTLSGTENLNLPGVAPSPTPIQFTGLYSIGPDGRGTMQFCENNGANACSSTNPVSSNYRIVVLSTQQIQIIPFDTNPNFVGTGEADSVPPDTLQLSVADLSGCYTLDFTGMSSVTTAESVVGYFCSNGKGGAGSITSGELDINNGGTVTTYPLNSSSYTLGGNNQGTMTLLPAGGTPLNLAFYMVSPSHAKFVETDALPVLSGDAFTQATPNQWGNSSLNAPFVFELRGSGPSGGITSAGRFFPDANGDITTVSLLDQNYSGTVTPVGGATVSGTYAVTPVGRGTITLTNGSTNTYIFYMIAQNRAVLQQTGGFVSDGALVPQSGGPFSGASVTGSYALNLAGLTVGTATRESILGQLTATGATGFSSGTLDINSYGTLTTGKAVAGTYTTVIDPTTGRGVINLNPTTDNLHFVVYFVSPTQLFVMETDSTQLNVGSLNRQF